METHDTVLPKKSTQRKFAFQIIKECSVEIGDPNKGFYKKITHKPCKICKNEWIIIENGYLYDTLSGDNICDQCFLFKNTE